jgi:hypothetical protein
MKSWVRKSGSKRNSTLPFGTFAIQTGVERTSENPSLVWFVEAISKPQSQLNRASTRRAQIDYFCEGLALNQTSPTFTSASVLLDSGSDRPVSADAPHHRSTMGPANGSGRLGYAIGVAAASCQSPESRNTSSSFWSQRLSLPFNAVVLPQLAARKWLRLRAASPGCTPYVRSERGLVNLLDRTKAYCDFFLGQLSGRGSTPKEFLARVSGHSNRRPSESTGSQESIL